MTEHNTPTLNENAINLLLQNGLGASLPQITQLLMNAAMLLERTAHLQADPHQRCDTRTGHANGFKPRGLQTAFGKLNLAIPQVRDCAEPFLRVGWGVFFGWFFQEDRPVVTLDDFYGIPPPISCQKGDVC